MKRRFDPSPAFPTNTGLDRPDTTVLSWICASAEAGKNVMAAAIRPRSTCSLRTEAFLSECKARSRTQNPYRNLASSSAPGVLATLIRKQPRRTRTIMEVRDEDDWSLRDHRHARRRRHGDRVFSARPEIESVRRVENDPRVALRPQRRRTAAPRSALGRQRQPSKYLSALRPRRGCRRSLHRHGATRGRVTCDAHRARARSTRRGGRDLAGDALGAGCGARRRGDAS